MKLYTYPNFREGKNKNLRFKDVYINLLHIIDERNICVFHILVILAI